MYALAERRIAAPVAMSRVRSVRIARCCTRSLSIRYPIARLECGDAGNAPAAGSDISIPVRHRTRSISHIQNVWPAPSARGLSRLAADPVCINVSGLEELPPAMMEIRMLRSS